MRRFSLFMLIAGVFCATTSNGLAQDQGFKLEPGARVRIVSPTFKSDHIMRILAVSDDSVQFRSERNLVSYTIPLEQVSAFEVSVGTMRRPLRGAGLGVLAGGIIGGVLGYVSYEPCVGCWFGPWTASKSAMWGGIAGGTIGLVVGATIGFFSESDIWRRIPIQSRLSVTPLRGGGIVSVSRVF
jgi:hypothetical protein